MLSLSRTLEVFLFSIANFAPYLFLSVYTFRAQVRFSKWITGMGCMLLLVVQFATRYWSALNGISLSIHMSILRPIFFLIIYAILYDIRFPKILFIELIFANMGNFILIAGVCLESNIFPNITHHQYCWHSSIAMMILHILLTGPITLVIKKYFRPLITNPHIGTQWYYYWIIPTVFYIIWQYQIHGGPVTGIDVILDTGNLIFLFIINIGAFLIYLIMIRLDGELAHNLELEEKNHYQDIALLEYRLLEERIEDARRSRHDMRHHIIVMSDYLDSKNYDGLREYLDNYSDSLPDKQTFSFCSHRTINSILLHYAQKSVEHKIDFQVQLSLPDKIGVSDTDISVLLGNLLENALQACIEYNGKRKIKVCGESTLHSLSFTIDNTCENEIKMDKQGEFLTTKENGSGLGIKSVKHIVKQHRGVFHAEKKGNMFYASFMLNY